MGVKVGEQGGGEGKELSTTSVAPEEEEPRIKHHTRTQHTDQHQNLERCVLGIVAAATIIITAATRRRLQQTRSKCRDDIGQRQQHYDTACSGGS